MILANKFYDKDACQVAKALLGKVIRRKYKNHWLAAKIIETEAYYLSEKGSHSSLGKTNKRMAMFMPPGTLYMYYARGHDSCNISVKGDGNAVLLKSCVPFADKLTSKKGFKLMQQLNPQNNGQPRSINKLCAGQTLLCRALHLKVTRWDQQAFDPDEFYIDDIAYQPEKIIQTTRLGIPIGRDEHKLYRFIDFQQAKYCTSNPLTKHNKHNYSIIKSF